MKLDLKANRLALSDPLSKAIPCNENCGTLNYPHNGDFGPVTLAASDVWRTALPAIRRDSEPLKSIGTTSLRFGSCLLSDAAPLFAKTNYIAGRTEFQGDHRTRGPPSRDILLRLLFQTAMVHPKVAD